MVDQNENTIQMFYGDFNDDDDPDEEDDSQRDINGDDSQFSEDGGQHGEDGESEYNGQEEILQDDVSDKI